ncbi:MAG: KpsF/GutQ family sugar-phosphate isomerase [Veillonella sp.]|nr:KpsF/GutQ family sugar-phosphate isomerase [Veillonella sp.]
MTILEQAAQVLHEEARAIEELSSRLDHNFVNAVNMILACKGRVVCTGMGKSGHIGRKIAATLASTGTPALFMHPGEGVHGDLGMITEDDVVLAFSNSGETGEIISILPSLRRIGAKLICVVGKPESTLAKNSDIVLLAEVEREACPLGLAPTTSTTVALALGDALAVCLLERHHFTPENFAVFHPGGSLGRKLLLTVENIMHGGEDNPTVFKGATVRDLGLVTDGDVRRGLDSGSNFLEWPVEDMMTSMPRTITKDKLAAEALHLMEKNQPRPITVLPVVDTDNKCLGIVHITDLLRRGIV